MNILHLKYAVEIARLGSLNKAAKSLYMGQPNLSRAIRELEAGLGITIFERSSKGMVPTPEGKHFLQYARKIVDQVDEVETIYKKGVITKNHFSVSVPRASYISSAFVQFTKSINQSVPFEIIYKETNAFQTINNILESDYKLGIIRFAEDYEKYFMELLAQKELASKSLTRFTYVLIMSAEHPLATKPDIYFSDLKAHTEILHADSFIPTLPNDSVKKRDIGDESDKRIYVFERSSQFELLCENTDTFMWVSSVPQNLTDRYGLIQKICKNNYEVYKDVLIHRKGYEFSSLDAAFMDELAKTNPLLTLHNSLPTA